MSAPKDEKSAPCPRNSRAVSLSCPSHALSPLRHVNWIDASLWDPPGKLTTRPHTRNPQSWFDSLAHGAAMVRIRVCAGP